MKGLYVTPLLRYKLLKPRFRGVEFSCRYDYMLNDIRKPNAHTTIAPMLSFLFADNYAAKFSIVGLIDRYEEHIPDAQQCDNNRLLLQFQLKF